MSWFTKSPIYRWLDDKIDLPSWLSWNNGDVNKDSVIKNPEPGLSDKTDPNNPGNNGSLTQNNAVNDFKKTDESSNGALGVAMAGAVVNPYVNWVNAGINALGLGYGIYNDYKNRQMAEEALKYQKQYDAQALGFGEKQFVEGIRQYEKDYSAQMQAMAQQQYNYENAYQLQAADMQKAGLNPLNAGGANGQSVSFSPSGNVSGSVGSSSVGNNQVNSSFVSLLATAIQSKTALEVAKINSETAKQTASISADASNYSADKQAETAGAVLEQRKAEFADNLSLAYSELDEKKRVAMIDEQLRRAGLSEQAAKRKAEALARDEEIRKAYAEMELLKKQMEQTKDIEEKKVKASKLRSWLMFIGDRIDNAVDIGKSLMGLGSSSSSGHNPIGFMAD